MAARNQSTSQPDGSSDRSQQAAAPAMDIVSVNETGPGSNQVVKVVVAVVVASVLIVGSMMDVKQWQAHKQAAQAKDEQSEKTVNKPAQVAQRRTFDTDALALHADVDMKGARGRGRPVVPELEPLPGEDARPIPLSGVPAASSNGSANGTAPISRFGGDLILTSAVSPTGPKTQHDELTPQNEALAMLRQLVNHRMNDGPMVPSSVGVAGEGPSASGQPESHATGSADSSVPGSSGNVGPGNGTIYGVRPGGIGNTFARTATANSVQGESLGSQLTPSATPKAQATLLGDRSLILPKGRTIDCSLTVRVVSGVPGLATCTLNSDVYSDNGRVVLLERGSEAVGEYAATMAHGQQRLFVLWNRVKTPTGVVVEVNAPTADELGAAGLPGYIDRHWFERLGAAFMLSIVQDAIGFATATQAGGSGAQQLGIYQNSAATGNRMAERILESTINIKPTLYKNQGDRAMIFVARDLDFSGVYALHAD
ncbi:MAG: type IV secretion system protein VirB10 [Nitrospira sp.]|nr:type IV secretion system protein VirB10 [Nitrospira sp.]